GRGRPAVQRLARLHDQNLGHAPLGVPRHAHQARGRGARDRVHGPGAGLGLLGPHDRGLGRAQLDGHAHAGGP
ncbi:unnamed protein product, partial [Heterosigma akashiwo]